MSKYTEDTIAVFAALDATPSVRNSKSAEPQIAILSEMVAALVVLASRWGADPENLMSEFERMTRQTIADLLAQEPPH